MELDCYQHYFLDDLDTEEDFYKSTAPSEDIWKKFELLPTPPMSPTRTFSGAALHFPLGDKLSWSSKFLGHEDECLPSSRPELCANLSSIIIRDCMWSSFSASKQLEKVSGKAAVAAVNTSVCPLPLRAAKAQCVSAATDCVDPAAVLAIPATNSCRKPASSGSESRSESSGKEPNEEDEEEIDVVTVEKSKRMQLMNVRKPVTIRVRADPCPKRFHVLVHRQQHNYAARSPDSEPEPEEEDEEEEEEDDEEPQCKRSCAGSDTSLTSDTEDTDRRKNHNFLERKRRNDLRSRFLALRDQIPGLEASKTPKVAILTHATEYLDELHHQERRQLQEKKRLKGRQQQLMRKLSELKRS
ncbi:hypothetical protein NQD34_016282 [Periophthalmus magnuspinnatus]|nr:hypothetical protein NQD34_016282 [Periophthalmus magnuspinnatus]